MNLFARSENWYQIQLKTFPFLISQFCEAPADCEALSCSLFSICLNPALVGIYYWLKYKANYYWLPNSTKMFNEYAINMQVSSNCRSITNNTTIIFCSNTI